jgi:hypothetical protein
MDTLSLSDRAWPKDSSQESDGADKQARKSAKNKGQGGGLFARARRIPGQLHTKKWIFSRESTRVDSEIPVTISGIAEDGHIFSEETRTLDISKRGAKIASSTLLAVGTYLWIESPNMQKPAVARVVRHGDQQDGIFEICVTLPEIDEAERIWNIESAPDDWKKGPEQPSAARRLERIYARDWVTKFESLSNAPTLPPEVATELEPSGGFPTPFVQAAATASEFKYQPGKMMEFVMGEAAKPTPAAVPSFGRSEERTLSLSAQMREAAASDVEVRLAKLTMAMESLERRVGTLVENLEGRIESSLQAVQGRGANHAEELERVARELGGQWASQFQEQSEAALAKLREELQSSSQAVEQSKLQLASLAEAKLASLNQATQDEYAQRLAQALREQTQEMHAAAHGEVNCIRRAAAEAIATLREELKSSSQAVEQSKHQAASLAEAQLVSLSQAAQDEYAQRLTQAFRGQSQEMHAAADGEVAAIRQAAAEVIAQLQDKLEQQAQAAVATLREELQTSSQAVEQSKQQLASLAEAKLVSLSQATQDEYAQRLSQALHEQTREMRTVADGEVNSIKHAAAEAIGQLSDKLEEQVEAAVATLREELQTSSQAVEQSKQQVASLAEAKLTSLSQAAQDEYAQRLVQALHEQTREMRTVADGEVNSIKHAAAEAIGQLSDKLEEQVKAAVATLREELQTSSQAVEQGKQQLASLAEAKLASLSQTTRDEYARRLEQALREQTQEMHAAADGEVNSIRQAAAEAVATLREELKNSSQAVEQSKQQVASLAESKLASLSQAAQDEYAQRFAQALREQTQEMHSAAGSEVASIRQAATEAIAQLQGKLEQQTQAAVATLREELKNSSQAVEQSKQQLASLAESKLASLSHAAQDEYAQRLAQALREQTQEMHAAADGEVNSIRQAAAEAVAQLQGRLEQQAQAAVATLREELQSSSQAVEQSKQQLASLAESKLASLSQTTRDEYAQRLEQALREQTQEMHAAADGEVESIRKAAAEAIATLREELKSSSQAVDQSKLQLASLAEAKLASLSQATQDEYAQRLAQALREQTQEMHAAADGEVKSIKQATAESIAQLKAVERAKESNLLSRAEAAEERLTGVTSAVEALKGRVGQLTEELEGQHAAKKEDLEGIAQQLGARWSQQFQEQAVAAVEALRTRMTALAEDFQATQTRKAEDLEKVSGDLEARCFQRIQEQAKEAVQRLTEEAKSSSQIVEETKKQLASLAQSSLAAAGQVNPSESGTLLAQALQEQVQQIQAAADAQVNALKQAAQDAIAEAQVAGQKREEDFLARTGVAEERLKAVSMAVESLTDSVHAGGGLQAVDLDNVAQELGNRMTQQFEKQTELAVEKVRAEVRNAGRAVEELARQLSGLAETKRATLNQVATNAAAGFEAQQRKLKMQFETARKDLEDLVARRMARISVGAIHSADPSDRKGLIVKLAAGAGLFLIMVASLLAVSLSTQTIMQLRNDAPTEFADDSPAWNAKRRDREHEVAQAYWRAAAVTLQAKYPFGSDLPAVPPDEFRVDSTYDPPGGAKALADLRLHYWDSVRAAWHQRSFWVEIQEPDTTWSARFHHTWEKVTGK